MLGKKKSAPLFRLKRNVAFLLMGALLFCWAPAAAVAEEGDSSAAAAPCKDLKPFNDLDELLYQFYINLDSDCLFNMPVAELEKIWDIKILSEEREPNPVEYAKLREGADFLDKPYKAEKDSFYIEVDRVPYTKFRIFYIEITRPYCNEYGTLFPDGNYPKLLPAPLRTEIYRVRQYTPPEPKHQRGRYTGPYDMDSNLYYWISSDLKRKILLTGSYAVTGVSVVKLKK